MSTTFPIPPRWTSEVDSDDNAVSDRHDLFIIRDHTATGEGWWVMMREASGAMIIFTDLNKEIAEHLKDRLELTTARYYGL